MAFAILLLMEAVNMFLTGRTGSSNFPCDCRIFNDYGGGGADAFIVK